MMMTLSGRFRAFAAATSMGVLGCGASGSLPEPIPGLPAELTAPGVYTVPAEPTVEFPIRTVRVEQAGGDVSIYYELPAVFQTVDPHIELAGAATTTGVFYLTGGAGSSTCTMTGARLRCDEHLSAVACRQAEARTALPVGRAEAVAVEAFCGDPIGVLSVQVPDAE
jgi:hypothetical protein